MKIGGWRVKAYAAPTGKSFRFVRACVRACVRAKLRNPRLGELEENVLLRVRVRFWPRCCLVVANEGFGIKRCASGRPISQTKPMPTPFEWVIEGFGFK